MDQPNFRAPAYYINRELSFLEFNQRVLDLAEDAAVPLLERVRFLAISSANLDEFFEIRVAGLRERLERGAGAIGADGRSISEQLDAIHVRARRLVAEQYRILNDVLTPALVEAGIELLQRAKVPRSIDKVLERHFEQYVEPVLSPLALDPARPFPRIQNKSLNFIVKLEGTDAFGRDTNLAILQVPRSLPRVVQVPRAEGDTGPLVFCYLSTIVQRCVGKLFEGMKVEGCWQFRVTRNSDLFVDEEEVDDLRRAVEGELAERRYGDAVRLETAHDCPADLIHVLLEQFQLGQADLYQVRGPVNLNRLASLCELVDRPDLKYPPFTPGIPGRFVGAPDLFAAIREKDVLLHHPFQSFVPIMDFLRQSARDPAVLAIKQTLYRSGADSAVVEALVEAARNGKDVTVIIELMARFDEAANIELANRLQEAGAHVMYGVVGYKTHAKLIMVVRREEGVLRRYCHVGTGNYHAKTARTYTDYGLFTCDEAIGQDLHDLFLQLTSLTRTPKLRKLLQSPFTLPIADCIAATGFKTTTFLPKVILQQTIGGQVQSLPYSDSEPVLYYNKQAFAKAHLTAAPSTIAAMSADAQKLKAAGYKDGMSIKNDPWWLQIWNGMASKYFVDNQNGRAGRATAATFSNAQSLSLLTTLQNMTKGGYAKSFDATGSGLSAYNNLFDISSNNSGMSIDTSAALGTIASYLPLFKNVTLGVAPLPVISAADKGGVQPGGNSLSISSKNSTAETAASWDFIQYMESPANRALWDAATGYVPITTPETKTSTITTLWKKHPEYKVAYTELNTGAASNATVGPALGDFYQVSTDIGNALAHLLTDPAATPLSVISNAQNTATADIQSYNASIG